MKMIRKLNVIRFTMNALDMMIAVAIEFIIVLMISTELTGMQLILGYQELLVVIGLIVMTEFIIPMLLERYYAKDERRDVRC